MKRLFLLSPANCSGARARMVMRAEATFPLAMRLRNGGAPLGEVFAFMSGLYFRGKVAYARRFGEALIITTNRGLLSPDVIIQRADLDAMATGDIDGADPAYVQPLQRDLTRALAARSRQQGVVLLGSVATGKYVDVLGEVLGQRLLFPSQFVGRGDMSRGGLMLRHADSGEELTYQPVLGAVRHGPRPPRLKPIPPARA